MPLFLPRTIERSAPTRSAEYGSIDGGSWNWLATAPLSRRKRFSPRSGFHGSSSRPVSCGMRPESVRARSSLSPVSTP